MQRTNLQLRAVDLARLAGVSAQQIRNYADAGILPPVPRTAAGYRRFGDTHRRALLIEGERLWDTLPKVTHAPHTRPDWFEHSCFVRFPESAASLLTAFVQQFGGQWRHPSTFPPKPHPTV